MRARREERWHEGSPGAIARCGQGKAWHTVAGTGLGGGATRCPRARTRLCSLLHALRLRRTPRHPCSVTRRSWERTKLGRARTLFVTLPHLPGRIPAETAGAVDKRSACSITIDGPVSLRSDGGRRRLAEVATSPWTGWQPSVAEAMGCAIVMPSEHDVPITAERRAHRYV